jgi:5-oxoprolinase (ATP-hydrolysing)
VTDANLFLGRLRPEYFPKIFGPEQNQPLDTEATKSAFVKLTNEINSYFAEQHKQKTAQRAELDAAERKKGKKTGKQSKDSAVTDSASGASGPIVMTPEQVAFGFIEVANESMCRPIRARTQARGYSLRDHVLACFGGAGGQHACALARSLGIERIVVHRFSGILSAYGLHLADVVKEVQQPAAKGNEFCHRPQLRPATLLTTALCCVFGFRWLQFTHRQR